MLRKRFLLYPNIEIANFQQEDRDNDNAHLLYMYDIANAISFFAYTYQCENIVFSFILVRRLAMPDVGEAEQVSHFLYVSTLFLTADFGDL